MISGAAMNSPRASLSPPAHAARLTTDRGTFALTDPDSYAYVTRRPFDLNGYLGQALTAHSPQEWETVPGGGRSVGVCPRAGDAASAFSPKARSTVWRYNS